jgi:hypothetical protein
MSKFIRPAGAGRQTWLELADNMKVKHNLIRIYLLWTALLAGITAEAQPVISQQPTNQTVIAGSIANFNVSVSGTDHSPTNGDSMAPIWQSA